MAYQHESTWYLPSSYKSDARGVARSSKKLINSIFEPFLSFWVIFYDVYNSGGLSQREDKIDLRWRVTWIINKFVNWKRRLRVVKSQFNTNVDLDFFRVDCRLPAFKTCGDT